MTLPELEREAILMDRYEQLKSVVDLNKAMKLANHPDLMLDHQSKMVEIAASSLAQSPVRKSSSIGSIPVELPIFFAEAVAAGNGKDDSDMRSSPTATTNRSSPTVMKEGVATGNLKEESDMDVLNTDIGTSIVLNEFAADVVEEHLSTVMEFDDKIVDGYLPNFDFKDLTPS